MHEESLVVQPLQRIVYDAIQAAGRLNASDINKSLMQ